MRADWRRQALQLPSLGEISAASVRAAYWRLIATRGAAAPAFDAERLREAKRQLLFELGVRLPPSQRKPGGSPMIAVED